MLETSDNVFGFRPLVKSGKSTVVIGLPSGIRSILQKLNKNINKVDSVQYMMDTINKRVDNRNLIYFRYIVKDDQILEKPNEIILSTHSISRKRESSDGYMPIPSYYRNYMRMDYGKQDIYAYCIDNFGTYADEIPRLYLKKCNADIINLEEIENEGITE